MKRMNSMSSPIAAAVCLLVAGVATAEDLNVYVGFTGIESVRVSGGTLRSVDLHIGSNETASAAEAHTIFATLVVKNANGASVCNSSLEFTSKVRPAVRPLRFQVFYPKMRIDDAKKTRLLVKTKYTLFGKIEVRSPYELLDKDQNQYTVEFPAGGTPSCTHLMSGQTG